MNIIEEIVDSIENGQFKQAKSQLGKCDYIDIIDIHDYLIKELNYTYKNAWDIVKHLLD